MTTAAAKLYRAAVRLRDLHPDMTLSQIQLLAVVADNPGIIQAEVFQRLGQTDSAVSRNIALLSDIGSRHRDGLELIDIRVNPQDRRERFLSLTRKGERLMVDLSMDLNSNRGASI